METQNRLSVERCRELLGNNKSVSDENILSQRNRLYNLARFLIEKFEELTSFITRYKTVDAKAKIVK